MQLPEKLLLAVEELLINNISLSDWVKRHNIASLLTLSAEEIKRLRGQINKNNNYEKWLDEKFDKERD